MLRVSADGMLPLAVARWMIEGSHGLAAFIATDELTFEGLLAALPAFLPDHRLCFGPLWTDISAGQGCLESYTNPR